MPIRTNALCSPSEANSVDVSGRQRSACFFFVAWNDGGCIASVGSVTVRDRPAPEKNNNLYDQ